MVIIEDIRAQMGLQPDDISFDPELLLHINSGCSVLQQGGNLDSVLVDTTTDWDTLTIATEPLSSKQLFLVKSYIYTHTRIMFDPPPPGTQDYMEKFRDECLWRLEVES